MTKEKAIELMKAGARLTHHFFSSEEWVSINNEGLYCFEDGCVCEPEEFWKWRQDPAWDNGWDLHRDFDLMTCFAAKQNNCAYSEVTREMRDLTKFMMFPATYGAGSVSLSNYNPNPSKILNIPCQRKNLK